MAQTQSIFGTSEVLPQVSTVSTQVVQQSVPSSAFVLDTSDFYEAKRLKMQQELNELQKQNLSLQGEKLALDRDKFALTLQKYEEELRSSQVKGLSEMVSSMDEAMLSQNLSDGLKDRMLGYREQINNVIQGYQNPEQFRKDASRVTTNLMKNNQYTKDVSTVAGVKKLMEDYNADDSQYDDVLIYGHLQKVMNDQEINPMEWNPNNFKIVDSSSVLGQIGGQYSKTTEVELDNEAGYDFAGKYDVQESRSGRAAKIYQDMLSNPELIRNYQNRARKQTMLNLSIAGVMPDKAQPVDWRNLMEADAIAEARRHDIDPTAANNAEQRKRVGITNLKAESKFYTHWKTTPRNELKKEDLPKYDAWQSVKNSHGVEFSNDSDYERYAFNQEFIDSQEMVIDEDTGAQKLKVRVKEPLEDGTYSEYDMEFDIATRANIGAQSGTTLTTVTDLDWEDSFNRIAQEESAGNPANIRIENDGEISGGYTHLKGPLLTEFLSKFDGFDKNIHDATRAKNKDNIVKFLSNISGDRKAYKTAEMDFYGEKFAEPAEQVFFKATGMNAPSYLRNYIYSSMSNNRGNMSSDDNIIQRTVNSLGGINAYEDPKKFIRELNRQRKAYVAGLPDSILIDKNTGQSLLPGLWGRYDREANNAIYLAEQSTKGIDVLTAMEDNGLTDISIYMDGDETKVKFKNPDGKSQTMPIGDIGKYKNFPGFDKLPQPVQNSATAETLEEAAVADEPPAQTPEVPTNKVSEARQSIEGIDDSDTRTPQQTQEHEVGIWRNLQTRGMLEDRRVLYDEQDNNYYIVHKESPDGDPANEVREKITNIHLFNQVPGYKEAVQRGGFFDSAEVRYDKDSSSYQTRYKLPNGEYTPWQGIENTAINRFRKAEGYERAVADKKGKKTPKKTTKTPSTNKNYKDKWGK